MVVMIAKFSWVNRQEAGDARMQEIAGYIADGAIAFLRAEWRVVWVIIEGKEESAHVRLAGPMAVVEKHKKAFDGWLKALK